MRNITRNVMDSIKIEREKLLGIVRENLDKHVETYKEAVSDYLKLSVKIASENILLANTKRLESLSAWKNLPMAPTSYEQSYRRAIRMLELSVEDIVEIDEQTFNQLVLDEWSWKQQFMGAASTYKGALG